MTVSKKRCDDECLELKFKVRTDIKLKICRIIGQPWLEISSKICCVDTLILV